MRIFVFCCRHKRHLIRPPGGQSSQNLQLIPSDHSASGFYQYYQKNGVRKLSLLSENRTGFSPKQLKPWCFSPAGDGGKADAQRRSLRLAAQPVRGGFIWSRTGSGEVWEGSGGSGGSSLWPRGTRKPIRPASSSNTTIFWPLASYISQDWVLTGVMGSAG